MFLSTAYSSYASFEFLNEARRKFLTSPDALAQLDFGQPINISMMMPVLFAVGTYFVADGLRQSKGWAWLGGISILLFSITGFSFPFAIVGLISFLDKDVRMDFIKDLEFNI